MTIANRLYAGFAFILLLLVITTIVGTYQVGEIDKTLVRVNEVGSEKQRFAINFRGSVHDRAIALRDLVLVENADQRPPLRDLIADLKSDYSKADNGMTDIFSNNELVNSKERELLSEIEDIQAQGLAAADETERLLNSNQRQQAQEYVLNEVSPIYAEWLNRINAFIDYEEQSISAGTEEVMSRSENFATLMWWVTAFAIISGGLVAWQIVVKLTHTIGGEPEEAAEALQRIADGDLTVSTHTRYEDSMMADVNRMVNQLRSILGDVNESASTILNSSNELAETAGNNQKLVVQQQEQTTQGATAIHQMSQTVREVAQHTEQAAQLADDTDRETVAGSREVEATVRSIEELANQVEGAAKVIGELSDNTAEIHKVLEVIEGIADQTNLLALNAAIEAARAGEHGRGFSVVADEVRALANRTQDSTRSIQSLIETMRGSATDAVSVMDKGREKAAESVKQARSAGESLNAVNNSVAKMSDMNAQIATAAEEQTAVAEEINQNFSSITEAAEQTAAGSEQISEASRELNELAKRLNNGMKRFKIA
ncbi:methyl-accepting chemotaxis protein [Idiomarina abyssalis]|uniref:methyl-accepting chemotaxis protein n=1 Tax=Idiomarina abyssalis TaxID=86102 RepID=UPI003A8CAEF1